ncbi:MAG: SGNH/GDSL hydrolase family protein, partial [Candidatus Hydrogenedentes bacterium]|nr:SGNH/GDSL hydrolase family protein [Candidatus Hydrogenedentota bacterium]
PLEMWNYRLCFYLGESEIFRTTFRSIYDMREFRVDIDKNNQTITCSPIGSTTEEFKNLSQYLAITQNIPREKLCSGLGFIWEEKIQERSCNFFFYPVIEDKNKYSFFVFALPFKGKIELLNPLLGKLPVNEMWDINYFSYLPHSNSTEMLFRTNNFGFRDRDFKVPKLDGVFRILCIGASTTEEGVSNQETYPKILERELQKYFGKNRIEVFNCGISGMLMKKHCAKLPDYLYLEPDMVILYEGVNDVVYEVFPHAFDSVPIPVRIAFLLSHFVRRQMRFVFSYPQAKIDEYLDQFIFQYIEYISQTLLSKNIDIVISSFGVPYREKLNKEDRDYYDYYYDKEWGWANSTFQQYSDVMKIYNQRLKEYCKKNGILYIPVTENIPASTKYFSDICHMRHEGMKLKAKIMVDTLIPYLDALLSIRKMLD